MGQEIEEARFRKQDFEHFGRRLAEETELLRQWFAEGSFSPSCHIAGFELETWLMDGAMEPVADNARFLERLQDPMVGPELAQFNVELNTDPVRLQGRALSGIERQLQATWEHCEEVAGELEERMLMVGIPATLREERLCLAAMSCMVRYRALNEQVLRSRKGRPLVLDIQGEEHLRIEHRDVMLESAATSFQLHLQVAPAHAARYFNASIIASAPLVAVSANSPFLFGKELWDETRIPLFEQAVDVGGFDGAAFGPVRRVGFGSGYVRESLLELFEENLEHYPVLLAERMETAPEQMAHLRLHNGTIWRWNRPLIGLDDDGTPHLRIEHRVIPSGPSLVDGVANAAFYYGLAEALAMAETPPEQGLEFDLARDNFYNAARHGLRAQLHWPGTQRRHGLAALVEERLLPMAEQGLSSLGLEGRDIRHYLGVIERRVASGQNGAQWQRQFVARHGRDWGQLMQAYYQQQNSRSPVHEWEI
jgi:gamma-glutamyl:cysteine ligase YbdK (ATP-grasp superfamily)